MSPSKVWYVTGASQGLGLSLVRQLLAKGYRVAAASRYAQSLRNAVGVIDAERFLPLAVDLRNPDSIDESVQRTLEVFGQIDVVVNNGGYGISGNLEETAEDEIKKIFEVNVLATIDVVKKILPHLRERLQGYIINIGSAAGLAGVPGWSIYSATKAAVAAFSGVLTLEVEEFGIGVTVVEPTNGKEPGEPEKAAEIMIFLSEQKKRPLHLYLGEDAYRRMIAIQ